jgi:hypothetical protein
MAVVDRCDESKLSVFVADRDPTETINYEMKDEENEFLYAFKPIVW